MTVAAAEPAPKEAVTDVANVLESDFEETVKLTLNCPFLIGTLAGMLMMLVAPLVLRVIVPSEVAGASKVMVQIVLLRGAREEIMLGMNLIPATPTCRTFNC